MHISFNTVSPGNFPIGSDDTGFSSNRDQYLEDVFSIVEPEDIRWVFISHDDVDHTGNVNELMALAPNATLVVNWFMWERMGSTLEVPMHRQRWLGDGEEGVDGAGRAAEWVARLVFSYTLSPSDAVDVCDEDSVRVLVRDFVLPGLTHRATSTS